MLATILKSPRAAQTTIGIVGDFVKLCEFSKVIDLMSDTTEEDTQKDLIQKNAKFLAVASRSPNMAFPPRPPRPPAKLRLVERE